MKHEFKIGDLAKPNRVSFNGLATPSYVSVYNTPLLRYMGFLNTITSTGGIPLINSGETWLEVDRLTTIASISLTKSLRSMTGTTDTLFQGPFLPICRR